MSNKSKLSILGGRQSGKTEILAASIFTHLVDTNVKSNATMAVFAVNASQQNDLKQRVISLLNATNAAFGYTVDTIRVGAKTVRFFSPTHPSAMNATNDYIFADGFDKLPENVREFIDSKRGEAIVIQTFSDDPFRGEYRKTLLNV